MTFQLCKLLLLLSMMLSAILMDSSAFLIPIPTRVAVGATTTICTGTRLFDSNKIDGNDEALAKTASVVEAIPEVKCPNCDLCDGSGRIAGGIGAVAPWWPIKAYRPCPNFIDRGGVYERSGQGLDEIAFGRDK